MNSFWNSAGQASAKIWRGIPRPVSVMFAVLAAAVIFFPEKTGDFMFLISLQEIGDILLVIIFISVPLLLLAILVAIFRRAFKTPPRIERMQLSRDQLSNIRAKLLKNNGWRRS